MPITTAQACRDALRDLEALAPLWDEIWSDPDADGASACLQLMGSHMRWHGRRIAGAMVLERLDEDICLRPISGGSHEDPPATDRGGGGGMTQFDDQPKPSGDPPEVVPNGPDGDWEEPGAPLGHDRSGAPPFRDLADPA